jgi:signal transduction histidine kinase
MITEMLELSKIQSGKLSFTKQRISGKDLMRKIHDKYSVLFDELGIIFEISENAMNLPDIYSNEERILQVINILLDNARKFVSEQGLIKIEVELHNKYVLMQVIDNGSGIDQSSINRIFDRFNKSDSIINKEGNGLGLSIAKEIIEGLNEKINVYSLEGENTKFSFSIQRV